MMRLKSHDLFHVHTYRCGHAEDINDEEYIKFAINNHYTGIWFTDHAPFPDDPFGGRMKFDELDDYLSVLEHLKDKYRGVIRVHIGLEIEYFEKYEKEKYYDYLLSDKRIETLLLGQHMASIGDSYTFSLPKEKRVEEEWKYIGLSIIQGIESRHFDAVAHPDRTFKMCTVFRPDMYNLKQSIIQSASHHNIYLEKNIQSYLSYNSAYHFFWNGVQDVKILKGADAHSLKHCEEYQRLYKDA